MKLKSVEELVSNTVFDVKVFEKTDDNYRYIETIRVNYIGEDSGLLRLIHLEAIGADVISIHVNSVTNRLELSVDAHGWRGD